MCRIFKFKTGILLLLLILLCGCDMQWQRYNNREYGFSILLPSSWDKQEGALKAVIVAIAPLQNKRIPNKMHANMNVFVTELPEDIKLGIIFELNKEELSKFAAAMNDLTEGEIYAGSLPGKWLSFDGIIRDSRLKMISAVWVKNKRIYTITCSALLDEFALYKPIFSKIMRSLRVK